MPTRPEDIVNRALDECGVDEIGDLYEGSEAARAALRIYDPVLRQLHSAAHWNFARRQQQLILNGDRQGRFNPNKYVPHPWTYQYDWPVDCVQARWVLRNCVTALDESGDPVGIAPAWNAPAPFLVTDAPLPNDPNSDWSLIEGHNPESTRVICCNELAAVLVYTGLVQYPDSWQPLFEQAMVATLAARLAMPLVSKRDMRAALQVRQQNVLIAKQAIDEARVRDGDEGWTIQNHTPDWIRVRTDGAAWSGPGVFWYGWQAMPMVEDAGGVY